MRVLNPGRENKLSLIRNLYRVFESHLAFCSRDSGGCFHGGKAAGNKQERNCSSAPPTTSAVTALLLKSSPV